MKSYLLGYYYYYFISCYRMFGFYILHWGEEHTQSYCLFFRTVLLVKGRRHGLMVFIYLDPESFYTFGVWISSDCVFCRTVSLTYTGKLLTTPTISNHISPSSSTVHSKSVPKTLETEQVESGLYLDITRRVRWSSASGVNCKGTHRKTRLCITLEPPSPVGRSVAELP